MKGDRDYWLLSDENKKIPFKTNRLDSKKIKTK